MLQPPHPDDPERILLAGGPGAGKTRAWLSVAYLAQTTGSDAHFYVLDCDGTTNAMLRRGFPELENVTATHLMEWDKYMPTVEGFRNRLRPQDWLVCDPIDKAWSASQDAYAQKAFGQTLDEYYLLKAKASRQGNAFVGADWQIIKAMYRRFANAFFYHGSNVLATAGVKALRREGSWKDPKDLVEMFDHVGLRPEGEKHLAHEVHTVLFMSKRGDGEWVFTTGKDRERGDREREEVLPTKTGWAKSYLVGVAGWTASQHG